MRETSQELRFRQVHLDFHTSELIPGIGSAFDPEQFVATLKQAHVDSVTLFSRCHHGMIYHETRFPSKHPNLTCNLLAEQVRACHAADIRCPIYISVGLDEFQSRLHPEWIELKEDGTRNAAKPLEPGWHKLDFASPYLDYVIAQTQEVLDIFGDDLDGLFFDIIHVGAVHSNWCLAEFERLGLDPAKAADQETLRKHLMRRYLERLDEAIRAKNPRCGIFHNSGHISPSFRKNAEFFTHFEVESLPTGGWGYMHFPVTARYTRTLGKDYLGMTGKFSETWGHFNSYKPKAALEYECFTALALAGKCSVGDQLHPTGRLDKKTYDLIGAVYAQVEQKEPWCRGAKAVTEIAVLNVEEFQDPGGSNLGVCRMLMEARHQFDFVDSSADLSDYRVVILPDAIPVDGAFQKKLEAFIAGGGSLIASYWSGLSPEGKFEVDGFPAIAAGELPFSPDFLKLKGDDAVYVMYERGLKVQPADGAEILAEIYEPYFNRTYQHFCSHHHTPVRGPGGDPGVLVSGRVAYFAHPIFATYGEHSMLFHRDALLSVLDRFLPKPLVRAEGPSTLQVHLTRQSAENRILVHLLHYVPERRGRRLDIVEEPLPLYDIKISLRTPDPSTVELVPQGQKLEAYRKDEYLVFRVPHLHGHQIVAVS